MTARQVDAADLVDMYVTIDGDDVVLARVIADERWNGFRVPLLEDHQLRDVLGAYVLDPLIAENPAGVTLWHADGVITATRRGEEPSVEAMLVKVTEVDGSVTALWETPGWCWDEVRA